MWLAEYRWVFLLATGVFLGFAYYMTYKNRKKHGPWGIRILHTTTVMSVGMIAYTFFIT
jgi:hypothetical protein